LRCHNVESSNDAWNIPTHLTSCQIPLIVLEIWRVKFERSRDEGILDRTLLTDVESGKLTLESTSDFSSPISRCKS
jgi:hypothetical protein